jgi:hypothetical protein
MNPNNAKIEKLFAEVKEENKDAFKKMENYGQMLSDKYMNVVRRLDGFFRGKCSNQVQWLESNTVQTQQGPKLKDESKRQEFDNMVESFRKCVEQNEIGAEPLLRKFEEETENVYYKFNNGVQACVKNTSDSEIKSCFRNLVVDNANETQRLFESFNVQFDDLNKKL